MVLLDWEKAYRGLFKALERMNLPAKILNLIKALYNRPAFFVELEGERSSDHVQGTGIRQGCPLSPYLFVIFMTVLFYDVHKKVDKKGRQATNLVTNRVKGATFDEILYADDTICISENETAINRLLAVIEQEGSKYRMKLNRAKCELFKFGQTGKVHFADGMMLKPSNEVEYLGCKLNENANAGIEVQKRISECINILNKLDIFWGHADCSIKQKLQVQDAVVRTKLVYGL